MNTSTLKVRSRLWIIDKQGTFLGEGRIRLLQAIDEFGSISKASHSMGMSYLKAWKLIKSMNTASETPLVVKTSGGKGGGGTILTEEGKKTIELYAELNRRCQKFLDAEFEKLMKTY